MVNFRDYIIDNNLSREQIIHALLTNTFKLGEINGNGHNYHQFVDRKGNLHFDNPGMDILRDNLGLNAGCRRVINGHTVLGNNIHFEQLFLVSEGEDKNSLISEFEKNNKQIEKLKTRQKEITEKLDYLVEMNKDSIDNELEFNSYRREKIKASLEKTTV